MGQLIFDESSMINGNIFKFEQRLKSHMNRYIDNGMILTTYFSQDENSSTVDRGIKNIDELFGKHAPLRYNEIVDFPICGFGQANPENTDEQQIEDLNVNGECIIMPSTIVPKPLDFFIINHLKMNAIFEVTNVQYDSMKVDGYYKISYRLHSTSAETIQKLREQVVNNYHVDLNAVGSNVNPVIQEDDFLLRSKINQMVSKMIESYRALYYNARHNCFLYRDQESGLDWFDMCGNEFIAKYSLMNTNNSTKVIVLHDKLNDVQMPLFYNNSIYNWLELGAPLRLLQKFHFILNYADGYPYSSFVRWNQGDIQIMQPLGVKQVGLTSRKYSYFDEEQFRSLMDPSIEPLSEYEKLIWKYIHRTDLTIRDISLYTADTLLSSLRNIDNFLYTPIVIYIIREILAMN